MAPMGGFGSGPGVGVAPGTGGGVGSGAAGGFIADHDGDGLFMSVLRQSDKLPASIVFWLLGSRIMGAAQLADCVSVIPTPGDTHGPKVDGKEVQ